MSALRGPPGRSGSTRMEAGEAALAEEAAAAFGRFFDAAFSEDWQGKHRWPVPSWAQSRSL